MTKTMVMAHNRLFRRRVALTLRFFRSRLYSRVGRSVRLSMFVYLFRFFFACETECRLQTHKDDNI